MTATTKPDQATRLVWLVNRRAHLSVGAVQDAAADLDVEACAEQGLPVLRRCLGGGAVWLDAGQPCFVLIQPKGRLARGHRHLFALGISLAVGALRQLGLVQAEARSQDIFVGGRKIMGSGAATLDGGCVFGASFLPRFPAERFLACIRSPSPGYREWVLPALHAGMTDCERELGWMPDASRLREALLEAVAQRFGQPVEPGSLSDADSEAWIRRGREELDELGQGMTHPAIPKGIRINRWHHVFETESRCGRLRLHLAGPEIQRIWCEEPAVNQALQEHLLGRTPERLVLRSSLAGILDPALVDEISCRIDSLYRGIRHP